jgi:polysaccharide chain length determinant protein (PEP-CTERM system associated)
LERIIRDLDLYKDARKAGIMEDVVQQMRSDIEVKLEGQESSFRVAYSSADPKTALKVTERLAALYIEENLRDREKLADNTSSFLESQLQDAKRRLLEQERKLEDYRHRYAGQLPSQLQGNLQSVQSAQMQVQALVEAMNRARERRLLVERQLADAQALPADVTLPGGRTLSPEDPAALGAAQQLEAARARLEAARLRYTADHPDVLELEQTIRDLETKVREEQGRPQEQRPAKSLSPSEIARQKRLKDLQAELEVIDHQLAAAQIEESRVRATIADYRAKIDAVPTRESELVELTRDYSTLQATYASLLAKQEDAKVAANLERRQIGEQFRILDPASLPARPHNQQQRLAVLVSGAVGGLALGLLLVGFLEYRDTSFNCEDDVLRTLSLPVLALVPRVDSDSEGSARRRFKWPPAAGRAAS